MKILALTLLTLLPAFLIAGLARSVYRRGAFTEIASWWRGASRPMKVASIFFATIAICYGGNKYLAGAVNLMMKKAGRLVGSVVTNHFSPDELATHYAVSSVKSGEAFDFTMPEGAKLADRIAKRGAHDDGFWLFDSFTNEIFRADLFPENHIWVHTDGSLTLNSRSHNLPIGRMADELMISNVTVYAPMQGPFGFLPNYRWEQYGISRIWSNVTDYGSRLITFEGALPNCDPDAMLSFQAEFKQGGDIVYRYSGMPTNKVSVGILHNGAALMPEVATNTTSVSLKYIGGLTDWQEVKVYGTDPRLADTDCDGVPDGDEIDSGTDPLNPDSDGDGIPDGWTRERYDSHRFFNGEDTDANVTVTLASSTSVSNRAVLKIGNLPIILREAASWTLRIPTNSVWNYELKTSGLPVDLELSAEPGVFVENDEGVFSALFPRSRQYAAQLKAPFRGDNTSSGSRGGSGRISNPFIYISPWFQLVHSDFAGLRLVFYPEAPVKSSDIMWHYYANPSRLDVSSDRKSAVLTRNPSYGASVEDVYVEIRSPLGNKTMHATVEFCPGRHHLENSATFSIPHTNIVSVLGFRDCSHKLNPQSKLFFEIEAGRETASGWQHFAWIDTDPETPGIQSRSPVFSINDSRFNWDMKADSSVARASGPDMISYGRNNRFPRILPAVSRGEYVPPPFVDILTSLFDSAGNIVDSERTRIPVPQYAQIMWDNAALDKFRQELKFSYQSDKPEAPPATNVTLFAACTRNEAESAFAQIPGKVQAMLPGSANIKVVGRDAVIPQRHKTVTIHPGRYRRPDTGEYTDDSGMTPKSSCHQFNSSPEGVAGVYLESVRKDITNQFNFFYIDINSNLFDPDNDWRSFSLPLSNSQISDIIAHVAIHELAHSAGLVPDGFDYRNGHNNCRCGHHYMDSGIFMPTLVLLGVSGPIEWNSQNIRYLNQVFGIPRGK